MKKNKWLASILNFLVPGLGNIYSRKFGKGIVTYILFFVVVFSLRFIAYNFILFVFSLALIAAYYVYLIVSGYRDVERNTIYEPMTFDKWYLYTFLIILHWGLVSSFDRRTLDEVTPINFASIPTPAMDPGLLVGDILALKKTKEIERNDVAIFWFPDDPKTMYVKRCIGLPGDSLRIRNSIVFINGTPLAGLALKFKYIVTTDGSEVNSRILEKIGIAERDYFRVSANDFQFFLTEQQAKALRALPFLKKVELLIAPEGEAERSIYPNSGRFNWNSDFFGSIYIPKKGDRVELSDGNIDFYLKCIRLENESVERDSSGLKINGKTASTYEFKENYFFMMGDNRHNSLDSRYWGLLPQRLVVGKALYLYWGQTSDRIGHRVI